MNTPAETSDLRVQATNKQIFSIALPITVSILVPQINMLVNTVFLGNLSQEALGNAAITGVFYLIFAISGNGFGSALQTVFSRYAGSNRPEVFKVVLVQGIRITLLASLAGILITYAIAPFILQAVADPMAYPAEMEFLRIRILGLPFLYMFQIGNAFLIASLSSRFLIYGFITQALVNILLDYLFIFGDFGIPAMGFNGAAVASVISEITGMLVVFYIIRSTGLQKKFGLLKNFSFDKPISSQILSISAPLVLQYVISIATWLAFFLLIEPKGTTAKAISNTMRNVFGIAGIFVWALAGTTNVMVSNLIGQGKQESVMSLVRRISLWSLLLCLILISILNLLPHQFFRMFGQDEAFVAEGIPVLRMVSLGLILMSVSNIWLNAVTGTGKTKMNLLIEVLAIAAYIPYTWYMMNVNYISLAMAWSNELFYWAVLFLISYWYMKSGKWKNDLS